MARRFSDGAIGARTVAPFGVHSLADQFERKQASTWPEAGADLTRRSPTTYRPTDWLALPSVSASESKLAAMVAVGDDTANYLAFTIGMVRPAVFSTYSTASGSDTSNVSIGFGPNYPATGDLYVLAITNTGAVTAPTATVSVGTTAGTQSFTSRQTLQYNGTLNRVTVYTLATTARINSLDITFATTTTGYNLHLMTVRDVDTAVSDGVVQIATNTGTSATASVTLGATPAGLVIAARGLNDNFTTEPGSGYTEAADTSSTAPSLALQSIFAAPGTTTPTSTQAGNISNTWGMIGIEIAAQAYALAPQYSVDWGDGVTETIAGGSIASHQYSYSSISSGTITSEGFRQAVVTATPVGTGRFSAITLSAAHPSGANTSGYRWKDVVISAPYWSTGGSLFARSPWFIRVLASALTSGASLFANCQSARFIELVSSASLTSAASMFAGCRNLRHVSLPDMSAVTTANSMFQNCHALEAAPLFSTAAVTNTGSMFASCHALRYVPQYNTSLVTNMDSMFVSCRSLESVPLFNTPAVTTMQSMFNSCSSLKTIPLFNTTAVTNMSSMFSACSALLNVPLLNTANVTTASSMFNDCASIESIPAFDFGKVTTCSTMFSGCGALRVIPDINMPLMTGSFLNFALNISNLEYIGMTWGAVAQTSQAVNSAALRYTKPLNFTNFTAAASPFTTCSSLTSYLPTGMKYSISCASFALDATALEALFDCLGISQGGTQTVTITGNRGAPTPISLSGTTTSGSTTVTMASTTGLATGMEISGTGISTAVAVTFQDAGDTVTRTAHGLANGTRVSFASITSTTGISTYTYYYVVNAATDTFQVAATAGGGALPLTTNGSGTMLYGTTITAITPNTSITLSVPASASGTVTTSSAVLKRSLARLKGWTVSG